MKEIMSIPIALDSQQKETIRHSYTNAVKDIGEYEYVYIENKINTKIGIVAHISIPWVVKLSEYYSVLNNILRRNYPTTTTISAATVQAIGAALFYFINPYDIIPDLTPDIGYADDYYVLVACLDSLVDDDRSMIIEELSKFDPEVCASSE